MDWNEDFTRVTDEDFRHVWRYEAKSTTVVRSKANDKTSYVSSLESTREWLDWTNSDECPKLEDESSTSPGLVLILAKRPGEREFGQPKRMSSDKWMSLYEEKDPIATTGKRALTFASLAEKSPATPLGNGQRSVRTLPFSERVFRLIVEKFYVHHSISAVVSRADIPSFSATEVEMKDSKGSTHIARVYNCRTSNAWEIDMALTATHFPRYGLTFAIIFGCPLSIEAEIIQRVSKANKGASHPLVLPGIFAELERSRHVAVVERMIDQLESRIYELDFASHSNSPLGASKRDQIHRDKREDFLDTSYLKNGLISWRNQLHKMVRHCSSLDGHNIQDEQPVSTPPETGELSPFLPRHEHLSSVKDASMSSECSHQLRKTGSKIQDRLEHIIEEYDDKIRDCTMRLDGMAMATQWAQNETNVDIALATGRDSKHMRSIALVTMVFLPGTFFAAVFSMSFFTWFNDDGGSTAQISSYFWVYVVFTVVSTVLTVGLWYYYNIWRHHQSPQIDEEMPLYVPPQETGSVPICHK